MAGHQSCHCLLFIFDTQRGRTDVLIFLIFVLLLNFLPSITIGNDNPKSVSVLSGPVRLLFCASGTLSFYQKTL